MDTPPALETIVPVIVAPFAPSMPVPVPGPPAHFVYKVLPVMIDSGPVLNVMLSVEISKLPVDVSVSFAAVHAVDAEVVFVGELTDCGNGTVTAVIVAAMLMYTVAVPTLSWAVKIAVGVLVGLSVNVTMKVKVPESSAMLLLTVNLPPFAADAKSVIGTNCFAPRFVILNVATVVVEPGATDTEIRYGLPEVPLPVIATDAVVLTGNADAPEYTTAAQMVPL